MKFVILSIVLILHNYVSASLTWKNYLQFDYAYGCTFQTALLEEFTLDLKKCAIKCLKTFGCAHFTWNSANNMCQLREGFANKEDALEADASLICAIFSDDQFEWNYAKSYWGRGCDFIGYDLASVPASPNECYYMCLSVYGCTHFVWTNQKKGMCMLKYGYYDPTNFVRNPKKKTFCGTTIDNFFTIPLNATSTLLWNDEFLNTGVPMSSNWVTILGGGFMDEKQNYTNANAKIDGSNLIISILKQATSGGYAYTSAKLRSAKTFLYGSFEMRAVLPKGNGMLPLFSLQSALVPINYPLNGQLDIMLNIQTSSLVNMIYSRVHTNKTCVRSFNSVLNASKVVGNMYDTYHIYKLDWNSKRVKFYVDGVVLTSYYNDNLNNKLTWPFSSPMYLVVNVAVGGDLAGQVDETKLPAQLKIDYVRQYASNNEP